jgi:transaldolase
MKIFLDTAAISEIKAAADTGLLDGVTTNPSLIAKGTQTREEVISEIARLVDGPISAEVLAMDTAGMLAEGLTLAAIHPNITVKLPMLPSAMPVVKALAERGMKTNVTLVFTVAQALMAAKAGATFVSPFVGRLDDQGESGMAVVAQIIQVFHRYHLPTQVLVASVRSRDHVEHAARLGADIATVPYSIFTSLFEHPLTTTGLKKFLQDANQAA